MKKVTILLAFLGLLGMQALYAQKEISGTITSSDDGEALPGVSVVVKGTTIGTTTDFDGTYKLTVPDDAEILVFSFVGMESQELAIGESPTINIALKPEAVGLDEVVVTAIGIKRAEKSLGYSATQVLSDEIVKGGDKSAISALQGKVAGANITVASGDPSASTRIILRGFSSFREDNQPLYIVDGVPVTNTRTGSDNLNGGYDFGNAANDINPEDIESVSILKGAGATVLYGSRAANGVVIITTKKGKSGKPKVTYSTGYSIRTPLILPEMQNTFGQGWDGVHTLWENGSWGPKFDGQILPFGRVVDHQQQLKPYVALEDNLRDFFDRGKAFKNSISVSGGTENTTYYVSFSNLKDDGIFPTDADSYNRNTFSFRGSNQGKKLKSSVSVNYVRKDASFVYSGQDNSVYNDLMQIPRDLSIVDFKDYHSTFNNLDNYYTHYGVGNPYYGLNENGNDYNDDRVYGNLELGYNLLEGLDATWRLGTDVTSSNSKLWYAITEPGGYNVGSQGSEGEVTILDSYTRLLNSDLILTYNRDIVEDLNLNVMVGHNMYDSYGRGVATGVVGLDIPFFYNISNSSNDPQSDETAAHKRIIGALSQIDLDYKGMVFLSGSFRSDWSSALPKENRQYNYAGGNLSFVFTELLESIKPVLSFGKIRANIGATGSDAAPYMVYPVFVNASVDGPWRDLNFPLSGVNAFEVSNLIGNEELENELTHEYEIGTDLRFFNGRFNIDMTYYNRVTKNHIFQVPLAYSTGYSSQTMNFGKVTNKGIEALISVIPVQTPNFEWKLTCNYTKNKNKVEKLAAGLEKVVAGGLSTISFVHTEGYPMGRFEVQVPLTDDAGHIVVDNTGLPIPANEKEIVGTSQPDYMMGLGSEFTFYKTLSLSVLFDIRQGGLMFSRTADICYFTGNATQTLYNDRQPFIVPNSVYQIGEDADGNPIYTENFIPIDMSYIDDYWQYGGAELDRAFLIDKSFVKLREVALTYRLPSKLLSNMPVTDIEFGIYGRNLLIWTPKDNNFVDPEVTTFGNDLAADFGEFSATPSTRVMGASFSITF